MGLCLDVWLCVVVCIRVSYSHAKQLATSEEAWPVLCMFQRVALHVSRSTTSQNPNHTDKGMCTSIHTQTHRTWLKRLWEWESMWYVREDQMCL